MRACLAVMLHTRSDNDNGHATATTIVSSGFNVN